MERIVTTESIRMNKTAQKEQGIALPLCHGTDKHNWIRVNKKSRFSNWLQIDMVTSKNLWLLHAMRREHSNYARCVDDSMTLYWLLTSLLFTKLIFPSLIYKWLGLLSVMWPGGDQNPQFTGIITSINPGVMTLAGRVLGLTLVIITEVIVSSKIQ